MSKKLLFNNREYNINNIRYDFYYDDLCLINQFRFCVYDGYNKLFEVPLDNKFSCIKLSEYILCSDVINIDDFLLMKTNRKSIVRHLIIDGYNLFSRAYKSFSKIEECGSYNHSIYGFFTFINRANISLKPTKIYIVFDGGGHSAYRESIDSDYK